MEKFRSKVEGIPCLIEVLYYEKDNGFGQTEFEYEIQDLSGLRAGWLEDKVKDADTVRFLSEWEQRLQEIIDELQIETWERLNENEKQGRLF